MKLKRANVISLSRRKLVTLKLLNIEYGGG